MQRLARAHANCIEGLTIFGGLLAIAVMTSRTEITDHLAFWLRKDRAVDYPSRFDQSDRSKFSRFTVFAVQLSIGVYSSWKLITKDLGDNMQFLLRVWPEADPWRDHESDMTVLSVADHPQAA